MEQTLVAITSQGTRAKRKEKRNVAEVNTITVTADQSDNQTQQLNLDAGNSFGRESYAGNANGNKRPKTGQQE